MIVPELSLSNKEMNALDNLIIRINQKLLEISGNTYESVAFGMKQNNEWIAEDLLTYRDIITQKINGCGCYASIPLKSIISKIKTLTA